MVLLSLLSFLKMDFTLRLIIKVGLIIISFNSLSQDVQFQVPYQELTEKYNLNSREVYKVEKDSKGNVWICSDGGVNMFNGHEFLSFTTEDGLVDNVVFDVYEDFKGRVWFLSYNSKLCYYENGVIVDFPFNDKIDEYSYGIQAKQKTMVVDTNDIVYYAIRQCGLLRITPNGELTQLQNEIHENHIQYFNHQPLMYYRSMFSEESLFAPFNTWLVKNNEKIKVCESMNSRSVVVETSDKKLFISLFGDIISVENRRQICKIESLIEFGEYDKNHFWVGTLNGLLIVSKESGEIKQKILTEFIVTSVQRNADNSIWVGTLNKGLIYIKNVNILYTNSSLGLKSDNIVGVTRFKDDIYISSNNFWQNLNKSKVHSTGNNVSNVKIGSSKNKLLVGSLAAHTKRFFNSELLRDTVFTTIISSVYESDDNLFWLSCGALFTASDSSKKVHCLTRVYDDENHRDTHFFQSVSYVPNRGLFLGSPDGLFELKQGELIQKNKLNVRDIASNSNGVMVLATNLNGIFILENEVWRKIGSEDGLLSDKVDCLEFINDSLIAIGGVRGVNVCNVYTGQINRIVTKGLDNINVIKHYNDTLWVGSSNGLFKISKSEFFKSEFESAITINKVLLDNEELKYDGELLIPYNSRIVKLMLSCKEFSVYDNLKLKFRLSPTDDWTELNSLELTIINPKDKLQIELKYLKNNGQWSESHQLISIQVNTPFYQRDGFIILSLIILIVVIVYSRKFVLRKKRKKAETKQKLFQLEQQIQQTKMNPHFLFNILNSIHSQIVFEEYDSAEAYLMKFSKFLRRLVSRTTVDSISVLEELEFLEKYIELQKVGIDKEFDFNVDVDAQLNALSIPAMLLQPLIENAIYYGIGSITEGSLHGRISLTISKENNSTLKVVLTDNGQGELKKKTEEGHAIDITRKRLSFYNELNNCSHYSFNISRVQGETAMTIVELLIPIIK